METTQQQKTTLKKRKMPTRQVKRLVYYCAILAIPMLQFAFFWVYVNFSSIMYAFNSYENGPNGYVATFVGFENFAIAFKKLGSDTYLILNSLKYFALHICVGIPLALIFSYYIYKNMAGSGLFRVILYLPQIISALIFALLFKYMVTDVYTTLATKILGEKVATGLLNNPDTAFATVMFFNVWIGFGTEVLLYSGTMSGISESIVESAELDGANRVQEFLYITLPMIYPTLTTFIITSIAGIVTNRLNLITLYDDGAGKYSSIGYYLYMAAQDPSLSLSSPATQFRLNFPALSALGLIFTAIIFPVTMITRKLMEKYGPSAN